MGGTLGSFPLSVGIWSWVCVHSLGEFIWASILLYLETWFHWSHPYVWLLKPSVFSSVQIAKHWGEGFDKDIPFNPKCFKVSHSLHMVHLLMTTHCKSNLLWWSWCRADPWVQHYVLGSHFTVMFLRHNNNRFSQRPEPMPRSIFPTQNGLCGYCWIFVLFWCFGSYRSFKFCLVLVFWVLLIIFFFFILGLSPSIFVVVVFLC